MKRFYTGEPLDVQALRALLEQEGVGVVIFDLLWRRAPELWLAREEDEPRARVIVERFLADKAARKKRRDPRRDPEAVCEQCGYLLYKLPKRRCPECGTEF